MTLVLMCNVCGKPYRSCDLSNITIDPPHYEDLPEPAAGNKVANPDEDRPEDRVVRLHYCERCLDEGELPPLEVEPDPDVAPKVHWPGTEHDDGGRER